MKKYEKLDSNPEYEYITHFVKQELTNDINIQVRLNSQFVLNTGSPKSIVYNAIGGSSNTPNMNSLDIEIER